MLLPLLLSQLVLARVKYGGGGDWYNDPDVLPNLAHEVNRQTTLSLVEREQAVELTDPDLSAYPFLYLTGHGKVRFSDGEVAGLRAYLEGGGFLYVDDDYGLDESFRQELAKVFPDRQLEEVSFDHPIYHMLYDLEGPPKIHEHYEGPPKGYGVFIGGKLALYYTYNSNVSDGWTAVHEDPDSVREKAFQMGVNMVLYALSY